jgi:hypothetical protein
LDEWENLVYSEVPGVLQFSNEVPRTSYPLLPPLAPPLLRSLLLYCRCQCRFPGHVSSLGRSPAPPLAPSCSTRHLDAGHRLSSSSLDLSRTRHADPSAARPPPRRRSSCLCTPPRPFFSGSRVVPASSLLIPPACLPFNRPEFRSSPPSPSSTPATLCSPWVAAVRLPLPTTTP